MMDGKDYTLSVGECIVIDSHKLHRIKSLRESMMITIYFSRGSMKNFVPSLDQYCFRCQKQSLAKEQVDSYLRVCSLLRGLAPLYVMQPAGYEIKSHAIAMEVFFELLSSMASQDGTTQKTEVFEHGFTNYKLFNKMFREVYGCTPREMRRSGHVGDMKK